MVFNARAGHRSPPRYFMMPMVALERLWCSMAAIICVVRLVLGGHGARATRMAARAARSAPRGSPRRRFVKPLLCAFPTRADNLLDRLFLTGF